jgi:tetratricopeptide (TPR) repeat protein
LGKPADFESACFEWLEIEKKVDPAGSVEMAEVLGLLAGAYGGRGELDRQESVQRQSAEMYKKFGNGSQFVANALSNLADLLESRGKLDEVKALRTEALAIRQRARGQEQQLAAGLIAELARQGKWSDAERVAKQDVATRKKSFRTEQLGNALDLLGAVLRSQGKQGEAEHVFRQSLALVDNDDPSYHQRVNNLAIALFAQDKMTEAEPLFREALKALPDERENDQNRAVLLSNLGDALLAQGKIDEAKRQYAEARKVERKAWTESAKHGDAKALNDLAWALATSNDPKARDGAKAVNLAEKSVVASNRKDPNTLDTLAAAYAEWGRFTDAVEAQQKAIALLREEDQKKDYLSRLKLYRTNLPYREFDYVLLRKESRILQRHHKLREAEKILRDALLEVKEGSIYEENPNIAFAFNNLGNVLSDEAEVAGAETAYRRALKIMQNIFGNEHPETTSVLENLSFILDKQGKLGEAETNLCRSVEVKRKTWAQKHPEEVAVSERELAGMLMDHGKADKAEARAREALAIVRDSSDPIPNDVAASVRVLANILVRQKKNTDAERLYNEYLAQPAFAANHQLLQGRGEFFARFTRWKEAAADLNRAIEALPDDHTTWHSLAPVLVQQGDQEAYREHCRKALERFGNTTDPGTAERMSKDSLILSSSGADLDLVGKLTDVAVSADPKDPTLPWFHASKAIAEYRRGNFAPAVDWAQRVLAKGGTNWNREIQVQMVVAMSQHQLKQFERAQASFAKGREIADTKLPKIESGDLGPGWLDWIIAQALVREAKALLGTENQTAQAKSPP